MVADGDGVIVVFVVAADENVVALDVVIDVPEEETETVLEVVVVAIPAVVVL